MKGILIFVVIGLLAFSGCEQTQSGNTASSTPVSSENIQDGIFIHVSSGYDNPQKVAMALSLADKFLNSHDVFVFFDIQGVNVITKEAAPIEMENYTSSKEALQNLIDGGATVMACPMCMQAAGVEVSMLMDGIVPAEKDQFFDFTDGRIMSLDY